jgi:hypothetical protein
MSGGGSGGSSGGAIAGAAISGVPSIVRSVAGGVVAGRQQEAEFRNRNRAARADLSVRAQQAMGSGVSVGTPWGAIAVGTVLGLSVLGVSYYMLTKDDK